MTRLLRRFLLSATLLLTLVGYGCSQLPDSVKCTTDRVYTIQQVAAHFPGKAIITGDQTYAEVNPAFAPKWHAYTGTVMNVLGMAPNWSQQFDCNRFANVKLAVIHIRFLVDTWHARAPGAGPAAGEYWYVPGAVLGGIDANRGRPGHAILVTIENGQKTYRDIYTDQQLFLTLAEEQSAYLIKF